MTTSNPTKVCKRCHLEKPWVMFYVRSSVKKQDRALVYPGDTLSECKNCMKQRSKMYSTSNRAKREARAYPDRLAIAELMRNGIHALPGKAISASHVDVVAWGCVWIEVKWARLATHSGKRKFHFVCTAAQQEHGFRAHVVMLICEYDADQYTYHVFNVEHPVFYIHDRVKSGFTFTPGAQRALKHGNNRVVMTQPIMDGHEDAWEIIETARLQIANEPKAN